MGISVALMVLFLLCASPWWGIESAGELPRLATDVAPWHHERRTITTTLITATTTATATTTTTAATTATTATTATAATTAAATTTTTRTRET